MHKPVKREPKKPYSKPTLTAYGTVRELTQTRGRHGTADGGNPRSARHGTQV
jgi:hypothetical protein